MSSATSVALGPTDLSVREKTHFGWFRHAGSRLLSGYVAVTHKRLCVGNYSFRYFNC